MGLSAQDEEVNGSLVIRPGWQEAIVSFDDARRRRQSACCAPRTSYQMKLQTLDIEMIVAYSITVISLGLRVLRRGAKVLDSTGMTNWKRPRTQPRDKMKTRYLLWLSVTAVCLNGAVGKAHGELSRIAVRGNQLVNAQGEVIVFRGLATSDLASLHRRGQLKTEYFDAARSWKANVVRFAVHPSAWRSSGAGDYLRLLDQGVRFATERNLYVIIDWHSIGNLAREKFYRNHFGDQSTYQTTKQETFAFWRAIARHYGTNTTVACFELFNEPTLDHGQLGDCSWAEWKTMMEELIAEIRANGGQAIPLVAGFNWAYDLRPVAKHPINATNLAYVSHPYPMKVSPPWEKKWTRDWGFVAEKYPSS